MIRRLKRVSPLQLGKVAGIIYALLSLVFIPFLLLALLISAFAPNTSGNTSEIGLGVAIVMVVLAPVIYGVFGFIFGALAGWIYNIVAGWTGGIEFEIE
jgi:hypothetical protein